MGPLLSHLGIGAVVFAITNIDDILLLAAFYADPRMRPRSIVAGQYLGIGALVLASALAALLAIAIPEEWVALLGFAPLILGVRRLLSLRTTWSAGSSAGGIGGREVRRLREREPEAGRGLRSQTLTVASVTIANGGDNIGVYVPLFATAPDAVLAYVATFAVLTGAWCALGHLLVNNPIAGGAVRRYGHIGLPVVLIALGVYILSGALVLLR